MTKRMSDDDLMDARDRARSKADDKAYDRMERVYKDAEPLIGNLQGESGLRYYINVRSKDGRLTGATKEFPTEGAAVDYLVRNHYI